MQAMFREEKVSNSLISAQSIVLTGEQLMQKRAGRSEHAPLNVRFSPGMAFDFTRRHGDLRPLCLPFLSKRLRK